MAYSLRADGLADVHLPDGTVMPMALSPQQLQAMGHTEISASAVRPPAPQLAVAGPGGGDPRDLAGGAGVFGVPRSPQEENAAQLRQLLSQAPQSHESGSAPSTKFDVPLPADKPGGAGPDLAPHTAPRTAAERPANDGAVTLTPEQELAFREATRGGGGPGKSSLALGKRTEKYTTYGAVPGELSADINRRGDELEQSQRENLTDHASEVARFQARREQQYTQQMDDVIDQRMQREAINTRLQQLQQTRDQREQEVATMPPPDLQRYWGEKGVAARIATGISIALGGYVQGLRGGDNPGLQMANDSIDRWMQTEREKYDRSRDTAARADNQYGKALAIYGTPEMAENDMRARAYAVRDAMLANQLDQINSADAFAKGQEALQAGALQRQQLKAQAFQLAGEKAVEDTLQQRQTGGGGGGTFLRGLKAAAEAKQTSDYLNGKTDMHGKPLGGNDSSPLAVRFPDGSVRFAGNAKEKTVAQRVVRSAHEAISKIDRLQQLTQNASSRSWGDEDRARAESLLGGLVFEAHDAMGVATFQEATKQNIERMVGDPEHFFRSPGAAAKLNELKRQMQDQIEANKNTLGKGATVGGDSAPDDSELPESAQEVVE